MKTFNLFLKTDDEKYGTFQIFVEQTMKTSFPDHIDANSLWGYVKGKHQGWFPIGITERGIEVGRIGHKIVGFYTSEDDIKEVNRMIDELLKIDPFFASMRGDTLISRLRTALESNSDDEIEEVTGVDIEIIQKLRKEKTEASIIPSSLLRKFIPYFDKSKTDDVDRIKIVIDKVSEI